MKFCNIIELVAIGLVLFACDGPTKPDVTPINTDTIPSTDTIVLPDTTIVEPLDTITIVNDTVIIGTGENKYGFCCPGPAKHMVLVKFYNPRQEEKVIVQHPLKQYGGEQYYDDQGLYLHVNIQAEDDVSLGLLPSFVQWMDQELHIAGTSPYIPLADGYYLIDWKWYELMPLCAVPEPLPGASHDYYTDHLLSHCFMTDINWSDLKDLTAGYPNDMYTQPVRGIEIVRADYITIDQLYNDEKDQERDPYICYNIYLYCEGLSVSNVDMYYRYGDCSKSGKTYRTYIAYCDSLQSVYRQRLIEIINNGQLKEIGF